MRAAVVAVLVTAALVIGPGAALAKGAREATITGPGLAAPVHVGGIGEDGEPASGEPLGALADGSGFFAVAYGAEPSAVLDERPAGDLGPRYAITWVVPGPAGEETLRQDLYPYADGGPVTFMAPDLVVLDGMRTAGGWFRGGAALTGALDELGLPDEAPVVDPAPRGLAGWIVPAVVVVLLAGVAAASAAWSSRRRSAALAG